MLGHTTPTPVRSRYRAAAARSQIFGWLLTACAPGFQQATPVALPQTSATPTPEQSCPVTLPPADPFIPPDPYPATPPGAVYAASPQIRWVLHAHSSHIWRRAESLGLPITHSSVLYGTPEMAGEVARLFAETNVAEQGIFSN